MSKKLKRASGIIVVRTSIDTTTGRKKRHLADSSNAARDLTTFPKANEQKPVDYSASPRRKVGFLLEKDRLTVWANSYAIVNNLAHISKLTATTHPK